MNKLDPLIKDLFYYDTDKLVYVRSRKSRTQRTMYQEFLYIFETQYGSFVPEDWEPWDTQHDDQEDTEGRVCVCTHDIHHLWYITHIPSEMTWQVGSECVLKTNLSDMMRKIMIKRRNNRIGRICSGCGETLMDLRKKYQKLSFCNSRCMKKSVNKSKSVPILGGSMPIPFGKYKNSRHDVLLKDKNYSLWILKQGDKFRYQKTREYLIENMGISVS